MATSNKIPFNKRTLTALPAHNGTGTSKAREYSDINQPNLKLEVTTNGTKTFCFRAQMNGKKHYQRIGRFPAVTIEEARQKVLELTAQIDLGADLTELRQARQAEKTLREYFVETYLPLAKTRKKSWRDDENRFAQRVGPKFGDRRLSSINRREIEQFLASLLDDLEKSTTNRFLALLSGIFRRAVEHGMLASNPCQGIKPYREQNARTRYLDEDEMRRFVQATLAEKNKTAASVLMLLLLTGMRKSEAKDQRWENVDLQRGIWKLERTKNGHGRSVPLSDEAKALLEELPSRAAKGWVFPGRDGKGPIQNIDKAFRRICEEAKVENFRIHDERHTHASWLAMSGISTLIIGQILGHRSQAMTMRYSHLHNDVLLRATSIVGGMVSKAAANEGPQDEQATTDIAA